MLRRYFRSPVVRLVVAAGVLIPWMVGASIKIYLDLHGKPTWEWLYFLYPVILLLVIWATFWFALPSLILGQLSNMLISNRISWLNGLRHWEIIFMITASSIGGIIGSIPVFYEMFWLFHPISLVVAFYYLPLLLDDYLLGLAFGIMCVLLVRGGRKLYRICS